MPLVRPTRSESVAPATACLAFGSRDRLPAVVALLAGLLALAPVMAAAGRPAQETIDPSPAPSARELPVDDGVLPHPELVELVIDEAQALERRPVGLARVRASYPQLLSVGIGAVLARQPAGYDCTAVCEYRGLAVALEPGLRGAQASVGYAHLFGERRHSPFFLSHVYVGWGVRAALLRTWGDGPLDPAEQSLLGVEGEFTIIGLNASLGVYRRIGGDATDEPWVVGGGLGWGF